MRFLLKCTVALLVGLASTSFAASSSNSTQNPSNSDTPTVVTPSGSSSGIDYVGLLLGSGTGRIVGTSGTRQDWNGEVNIGEGANLIHIPLLAFYLGAEQGLSYLSSNDMTIVDFVLRPMITFDSFSLYGKGGYALQGAASGNANLGPRNTYNALYLGAGLGYDLIGPFQLTVEYATTSSNRYKTASILGGLELYF